MPQCVRNRLARLAWLLALAPLLLAAQCAGPQPPVTNLFVNPLSGLDSNPGTESQPLKTLKHALELAASGQTVYLQPGTYDASSGEDWSVMVPDGVDVVAVVAGQAVLDGTGAPANTALLTFAGSGGARNLLLQNYQLGISADSGSQTLSGLTFEGPGLWAVQLGGSANATLANATISGGYAASVSDSAELTMTGGSVSGAGTNGFFADGIGKITLDGVSISDLQIEALDLRQTASAVIRNSTISNSSCPGCGGSSSIDLSDTSSLTLENTTISGAYGQAVLMRDDGTRLTISGGSISNNGTGTAGSQGGILGQGTVTIDGTSFGNANGADLFMVGGSATVTNATFTGNGQTYGIQTSTGVQLKLRNSTLSGHQVGLYLGGDYGIIDLGTAADPGNNTITNHAVAGLQALFTTATTIDAAGNNWTPNEQGADAAGHYPSQLISGPASGKNYDIPSGVSLQF